MGFSEALFKLMAQTKIQLIHQNLNCLLWTIHPTYSDLIGSVMSKVKMVTEFVGSRKERGYRLTFP